MMTRLSPEQNGPTRIYMNAGDREWVFIGYVNDLEIQQDEFMDAWDFDGALRLMKPRRSVTITMALDEMFIKDLVPADEVSPVGVEVVPEVEEVPAVVEEVVSDIPADWKVL